MGDRMRLSVRHGAFIRSSGFDTNDEPYGLVRWRRRWRSASGDLQARSGGYAGLVLGKSTLSFVAQKVSTKPGELQLQWQL